MYNEYLELEKGDIQVGEKVCCCCAGYSEGMVTHIDTDGFITISVVQPGVDIKYPSVEAAKITWIFQLERRLNAEQAQ